MASKKGFTLLEVLISVVILSIISTLTAMSIQRSTRFKGKIEKDIDEYSSVRDALVIITRDVNQAFHWYDISEEIKKKMIADAKAAGKESPFGNNQQVGPAIPTEKLTSFIGAPDSLYLTTLSHQRTLTNAAESDQAEIGYYIKSVRSVKDQKSTKALVRSVSTLLDDDVTKGGKETVLLEDIKSLKFKYLGGDNKDWVDTWKSTGTDESRSQGKFPNAVEINLTVGKDKREFKLSTVAAVHMPNNEPPGTKTEASPGASPGISPGTPPGPTP
ncbi:MAG: type II secretion system protein GspJ [Oligoflexia bacterium]|nr:type II secretion system protein GspJ [Oligoflexia bacterium]